MIRSICRGQRAAFPLQSSIMLLSQADESLLVSSTRLAELETNLVG
jgi:hypothetical protein